MPVFSEAELQQILAHLEVERPGINDRIERLMKTPMEDDSRREMFGVVDAEILSVVLKMESVMHRTNTDLSPIYDVRKAIYDYYNPTTPKA